MADYVSNCPISGPRKMDWKMTWDLGGIGWSYEWGMFYNVSSTEDSTPMRRPVPPSGGG